MTIDPRSLDLAQVPQAVRETLQAYLKARSAEAAAIGGPVANSLGYLSDFVLGDGKRLRPLFGWAGFVGAGGLAAEDAEDPAAVLRAVSALEFIQACALIHDDIIDRSETRRGAPTVHRAVAAQHASQGWLGDGAHFGESVAILVGDLALSWAEDLLQDSGLSEAALRRVREPWRAMRTEVIGGQLLDVTLEAMASEDIELAENVNIFKTAKYTVERPLHLGAAIAGANAETIAAFRRFGHDVGVAFQLRDDLLGVFGDPQITGKPAGDDLSEGKRTVLLALALKDADARDPQAAATLRAGVGRAASASDIAELTDIIAATSAPAQVEARIEKLVDSGLRHLATGGISEEVRALLSELAVRSTQRVR